MNCVFYCVDLMKYRFNADENNVGIKSRKHALYYRYVIYIYMVLLNLKLI